MARKCYWFKVICLLTCIVLNAIVLYISFHIDYQTLIAEEHVKFRKGFPSQVNWIPSPIGTLKCYLFNVTNPEAFLNGTDTKIKLKEIGPIVYRIKGRNNILEQTDKILKFEKVRYDQVVFDPKASCAPDILNQTVVLPNFLLLGTAAKLHDWVFLVRHALNAVTINEAPFLQRSIYYFLWEFTTPALNLLANYMPNIKSNCGILYNALRSKTEVYEVNIGLDNGIENFFRVKYFNNKTYFSEQEARFKLIRNGKIKSFCPINVANAFDNSVFPPFLRPSEELMIIAPEACRVHRLIYNDTVFHLGFTGFRYKFDMKPNCLDTSLGINLFNGMFDVASCLINDVPSAFSAPHFFGSTYRWEDHFEGLNPDHEKHEPSIIIEPTTGIPIEEKYRFQSNIPMPEMTGYNKELTRFNKMVVPTFWYEYDLDDLPVMIQFLMKLNVYIIPIAQPIFMFLFVLLILYCMRKIYLISK